MKRKRIVHVEVAKKKKKKVTDHRLLKYANPAMFAELDPTLNPDVNVNEVEMCSTKKLKWRCLEHKTCDEHIWEKSVAKRLICRFGCSYCNKNHNQLFCKCAIAKGEGRLLYISHPKIFAEIDRKYHENEEELQKLPTHSTRRLHFHCTEDKCKKCKQKHVWETTVASRTQGGLGGCPWCTKHSKLFCRCYSFASRPDLLAQLHPTQNEKFEPKEVPLASWRRFVWVCDTHKTCDRHIWEASLVNRASQDNGCPWCASNHKMFCECDSLATHPLAAELDAKANKLEGIDPRKLSKSSFERVNWFCNACGHCWKTAAINRTGQKETGCPKCAQEERQSRMERICYQKLRELKIAFEDEQRFPDCRDVKMLKFDFCVPSLSLVIELDGPQHFRYTPWFHNTVEKFHLLQKHDGIKNKWARDNGYSLLRISYKNWKQVDEQVGKIVEELSRQKTTIIRRYIGTEYETPEYRPFRFE